ncbi:hypothetical protein PVK06_038601 [Gossypium arboreum]|uniref:Exo_endo_phos domain-containing protein n=1 Tax=Gossypium arboreum TaxID=29729 RepID=A0ABR0N0M1_GOSAR|nr:hypothetical protein PVK06_038601 [Gossypium arboreum]
MKTISWNARGLGSLIAIRRLQFLLKQYTLQLVFLMETKVSATRMEKIRRKCGYMNEFDMEADGTRGFYGNPFPNERYITWNLLRQLSRIRSYPWIVCGDFNEILYSCEKRLGAPREEKQMAAFRSVLAECQLMDVGFSGS